MAASKAKKQGQKKGNFVGHSGTQLRSDRYNFLCNHMLLLTFVVIKVGLALEFQLAKLIFSLLGNSYSDHVVTTLLCGIIVVPK